jgi:hypothetical protein
VSDREPAAGDLHQRRRWRSGAERAQQRLTLDPLTATVAERRHGGGPRDPLEHAGLAEVGRGGHRPHAAAQVPAFAAGRDIDLAVQPDEQRIGGLALAYDRHAGRKRLRPIAGKATLRPEDYHLSG